MTWDALVRFLLQGDRDLEAWAILLVRVALGLFFAISGGYKLFVPSRTKAMYDTLVDANVPFPQVTTYFVSAVELFGGCMLGIGLLSSLASLALLVDMLVAIVTSKLSGMPEGLSPLDWLDNFLYLPETLYVLFFVWLICSGPGRFSVDSWIASRLGS